MNKNKKTGPAKVKEKQSNDHPKNRLLLNSKINIIFFYSLIKIKKAIKDNNYTTQDVCFPVKNIFIDNKNVYCDCRQQ